MKKHFLLYLLFALCFSCKESPNDNPPAPSKGGGGGPTGPFVSTAVVPIRSDVVDQCFQGNGLKDVHPRLFFTAADIARVKATGQSDAFATGTYNDVLAKADAVLTAPLLGYGLDGAGLRITNIHTFSNEQLPYLVLAYQFTKDPKYALRCWQQLDRMCAFPDWGANRHFLDAGIAAKGVAMAYDGLYDYLTPAQRTQLVTAVRTFVLEPGKTQIETSSGGFKWYLTNDNWNGICHGGMISAALAMYETDPAFMSQVVAICANGTKKYMDSLEPDGASEEGMSYWSYGLSNTVLAFDAMKRILSTTYGLTDGNGFRKTGWFPFNVSGPVGTATMGDDYIYSGKDNKFLSYFWFAKHLNDPGLARAQYDAASARNASRPVKMNGWLDLLYYDRQLVNQGSAASFPLNGYVRGIDYLYVQENNTSDQALYVAMHGGDNNASHGHLDAGSFYLQALGETWAQGNLGAENPYPRDYFTNSGPSYTAPATTVAGTRGRFYYYRVRTEGKNCLVFNPDARPEQTPTGVATVAAQQADNTGGFYVLNLADVYTRDVTAYKRGIKLNRSSGIVTVQDEFTPVRGSTVYWLMHSPATDGLLISTDGQTATMTKNGKTYYAVIKAPAGARFTKVDRSTSTINYLPETAPIFAGIMASENTPNQWYGKLQIKLDALAPNVPTTIRVDFVKAATATTPALTALNSWTTSN
ncbi:DUF4962 domain-containing protein [Hymenobacter armeniacus]|uniref:DUF4962 domain-containing protein n=1 Tax=Hymenobacter armeniacus TaxID=2771358 RepID=A0ABR8JUV5_9BACT|nr:DUF4962 domain-containing protein [Hymenobacter armeniacus]MBD2723117.1 hypothetical protein [Hymenobacter armeniacus]